jgi:hypothetical protein
MKVLLPLAADVRKSVLPSHAETKGSILITLLQSFVSWKIDYGHRDLRSTTSFLSGKY